MNERFYLNINGEDVKVEEDSFQPLINSDLSECKFLSRPNEHHISIEWSNLKWKYTIDDLPLKQQEQLRKCMTCKNGIVFNIIVFCDIEGDYCRYEKE